MRTWRILCGQESSKKHFHEESELQSDGKSCCDWYVFMYVLYIYNIGIVVLLRLYATMLYVVCLGN